MCRWSVISSTTPVTYLRIMTRLARRRSYTRSTGGYAPPIRHEEDAEVPARAPQRCRPGVPLRGGGGGGSTARARAQHSRHPQHNVVDAQARAAGMATEERQERQRVLCAPPHK